MRQILFVNNLEG